MIGAAYDGVTGYASTKSVLEAAELFRVRGCDSFIAIGGENCAAVARGVNLLVSHKTDDLLQFTSLPDAMHLRPFIVIPTSDSTGGETSSQCVIDSRVYKSSELMPDIAVIDPRILKRGDKSTAVHRAVKAMAEAIEACSEESANPMNDSFAFAAIQLIYENLYAAIKGGFSSKARLGLANGIVISGIVGSNSPEGLCSALAGELAKNTGNSRELCTALLLPYVLDYKLNETKSGVRPEIFLPLGGIDRYCTSSSKDRSRLGVDTVKNFIQSMNSYIPESLKALNIPEYILESTAAAVDGAFSKQYGKGGAFKILKAAHEGGIQAGGRK